MPPPPKSLPLLPKYYTINSGIGTPRPSPRDRKANPRRGTNSAAIFLVLTTTVMGQAQNSAHDQSPSRGSEAPTIFPGHDLYIWRKAVAECVDLVHTAATQSEDRHFKTVNATLGRQLYRALPSSHRSIVDKAQARGIINFRQSNQLTEVEEIVKLLVTDPHMAIVSRLITTFTKVTTCSASPRRT
jgi:hypothetical protein